MHEPSELAQDRDEVSKVHTLVSLSLSLFAVCEKRAPIQNHVECSESVEKFCGVNERVRRNDFKELRLLSENAFGAQQQQQPWVECSLLTTGEQVLGMVTRVFTVLKTLAPSATDRPQRWVLSSLGYTKENEVRESFGYCP